MTKGKRDPTKNWSFSNTLERDPYAEGWDAQVAGDGRSDNPYTVDQVRYSLWDRGFVAAAKRDEQRTGMGDIDLTGMGF